MRIIEFFKNRIRLGNIILLISLLILAIRFYPSAGRFLDLDEEYYFYITSFISKGMGLYTDLHFYYPPLLWHIGAIFFKLPTSLYQSMLATRIFVISLSLVGFYFIFDMFKKLKLSWFIIPTTIFILYSIHFDLKLLEYRSDNLLFLVLILQGYLIFLLSQQDKFSAFKIISIIFLGILTFHINHKAVYIEPPLILAFLICHFEKLKQFAAKYKIALSLTAFLGMMYLVFSESYHQFFYMCYIYPSILLKKVPELFPEFSHSNKINFLVRYAKYNIAFWLVGLASSISFLFYLRKDKKYLVPLMFLIGTVFMVGMGIFPFIQYQLFCVWAVLFSLPYFINICCEVFPQRKTLLLLIILLLSLTGIFTFKHYTWPLKPLKTYAAEIDQVREVIGQNGLASFWGASINIKTDLPLCDFGLQFRCNEKYCQSKNIRGVLKKKETKFIFIDQRKEVKNIVADEDGYFIKSNYQQCPNLPLMIASKWVYVDSGTQNINVPLEGNYKIILPNPKNNNILLNNRKLKNSQILYLKQGAYLIKATKPATLLIEFNSGKINSESFDNLNLKNYEFVPLNKTFDGKFKLLGIIKYPSTSLGTSQKSNKLFYRLFWKALSNINNELMNFHHFHDANGNYMAGANIDPTDSWYDIRNLKKDEVITYEFSIDENKKVKSINIGWYFKRNWNIRLKYGNSTFFKLHL